MVSQYIRLIEYKYFAITQFMISLGFRIMVKSPLINS